MESSQAILHELRPIHLDDTRIVIAIRELVIQGGETMAMASLLHVTPCASSNFGLSETKGRSRSRKVNTCVHDVDAKPAFSAKLISDVYGT